MADSDTLRALEAAARARAEADARHRAAIRAAREAGHTYRAIAGAAGLAVSHVHGIVRAERARA